MKIDCLKCINSACCKLTVEVDRNEYNKFWKLDLDEYFETRTDVFLKENPKYLKRIKELDEMHKDNFAILKKRNDGNCILLNENMECSIYENRPKACREYKQSSCVNIRELKE
ncbi:MAG: YkgJ family cysteine cluster protein [Methylococcaceae bacterium]